MRRNSVLTRYYATIVVFMLQGKQKKTWGDERTKRNLYSSRCRHRPGIRL